MSISIFTWDKLYNDLNFKDIRISNGIFFDFADCREKVHNNIEFSCANWKPHWDSQITTC